MAGKEQVEELLADIESQFAEVARLAEEERQEQMRKALAEDTSSTAGDPSNRSSVVSLLFVRPR